MKLDEVRWGFIGCGDVTEKKSGPAFNQVAHSKIVSVMRRNGVLAKDYAQRHGISRWTDDADKLIHDSDVNAVYIATNPDSHCEYVCRAAAAGKAVYVEKPMANSISECDKMLEACNRANVPLFVAYYRRMLPHFIKVKELLESGVIGPSQFFKLELVKANFTAEAELAHSQVPLRSGITAGREMYNLACHQLDLVDYLLGPIAAVSSQSPLFQGDYRTSETLTAVLRLASGLPGLGVWCFSGPQKSQSDIIEIVGTRGRIQCGFTDFRPVKLITAAGEEEFPFELPTCIQQPLIQSIVDDLRGIGQCNSTGVSGARTNRVLEALAGAHPYPIEWG